MLEIDSTLGGRCLLRDDGTGWDYFPFGIWGAGYRIGAAERNRLRWVRRVLGWIGAAVIAALGLILWRHYGDRDLIGGVWLSAGILAAFCPQIVARWMMVRRLPPANRRLSATEIYLERARRSLQSASNGAVPSWTLLSIWILFIGMSVWNSWERGFWFSLPLGILFLALLLVGLLDSLAVWRIARRLRREGMTETLQS